jgi:hypothetical protein
MPYLGNILTIRPIWQLSGATGVCVLNYQVSTPPAGVPNADQIAADWFADTENTLTACRGDDWYLSNVLCRIRVNGQSYDGGASPAPGAVGTFDNLPNQDSALFSLRTAYPGPRGRGRVFLPPPREEHTESNRLNAAGISAWGALATKLLDGFLSGNAAFNLAVLSRKDGALRVITAIQVRSLIARQGGRRPLF